MDVLRQCTRDGNFDVRDILSKAALLSHGVVHVPVSRSLLHRGYSNPYNSKLGLLPKRYVTSVRADRIAGNRQLFSLSLSLSLIVAGEIQRFMQLELGRISQYLYTLGYTRSCLAVLKIHRDCGLISRVYGLFDKVNCV